MKKRVISFVLAAALAASVFAGCGSGAASSNSGSSSDSQAADPSMSEESQGEGTAKFDDVKLKYLICWNGGYPVATDQYNNEVATAIREKIGVTVEIEGIMMAEVEKLNLMFASGEMPDMINAPYWGGADGCTTVIKKGAREGRLIDIKDKLENYPNLKDVYTEGIASTKYLENDLDPAEFNGARYILPWQLAADDANETNWAYGVFVRADVPKALGIDPLSIKTSDELYDFMMKAKEYGFKDVNGNDIIVATTGHEGTNYEDYSADYGQKKLSTEYSLGEDGKVTDDVLTEDWINRNLFTWKLVNNGILDKECFKHSGDQSNEKIGNGTALFAATQYETIIKATKLTGLYESNPEMRYIPVGPLTYKDGQAQVQVRPDGRSGSPAIIFPTSCQNVDAALTWLDYVNSEEGMTMCQYGFEGDTYTLNEEGQPRMTAELTERYRTDSEGVKSELRERGINYISNYSVCVDHRRTWWGEQNPFEADAIEPERREYWDMKPVERIKGYQIDAFAPGFERYEEVLETSLEAQTRRDYRERAFFAETEDEARQILKDYQNYMLTQNDGLFQEFLDYMTEQYGTRDDITF